MSLTTREWDTISTRIKDGESVEDILKDLNITKYKACAVRKQPKQPIICEAQAEAIKRTQ